ncbi:MAG: TIGR04255 family protein [Nostoc sp. S4]|nr:TIGR04255 family protein [Nostoc sp. S4]
MTNTSSPSRFPQYEEPPIVEVACSILFESIEALQSPHIGLAWQIFQPDYPFCRDVAPLVATIESFDEPVEAQFRFTDIPPLPRAWFLSPDETGIIQIQRDRFIHNWRKITSENDYPRYETIINSFQSYLSKFNSFLQAAELGEVKPRQYELIYINHIPQGQGWRTLEDIGNIFPDFAWRANARRLFSEPKTINWATVFELPNQLGRLHVVINSVIKEGLPALSFELTARGIGNYKSLETMKDWFYIAHKSILQAFTNLTDQKIQKDIWKQVG